MKNTTEKNENSLNRKLLDYTPALEVFNTQKINGVRNYNNTKQESVFNATEELDLATSLLEAQHPISLSHFINSMVLRAGIKKCNPAFSDGLKVAAQQLLLPNNKKNNAKNSAESTQPNPAEKTPSTILGLELEGLSPEDQEFEIAKGFIRFAGNAIQSLTNKNANSATALQQAAQRYAPGLASNGALAINNAAINNTAINNTNPTSGSWRQQGNIIIVDFT